MTGAAPAGGVAEDQARSLRDPYDLAALLDEARERPARAQVAGPNETAKGPRHLTLMSQEEDEGRPRIPTCAPIVAREDLPPLPPELVGGLLRVGGKLLVSGPSKCGKSFLLAQLAVAVATGGTWLGMRCLRGRVLYLNLEIGEAQFMHRMASVLERMGADPELARANIVISNLRGRYGDVCDLVCDLAAQFRSGEFDLVILDPCYKVQPGSENDADSIKAFCGELDRLSEALGASVAYAHHHSKGSQAARDVRDRASGSGVFARDADALLDLVELDCDDLPPEARVDRLRDACAFRVEAVARDFAQPEPKDVWFAFPLHEIDESGALCDLSPKDGAGRTSRTRSRTSRPRGTIPTADGATPDNRRLRELEDEIDAFMGEAASVGRKAFLDRRAAGGRPMDPRTFGKLIEGSGRFYVESGSRSAEIVRRDRP